MDDDGRGDMRLSKEESSGSNEGSRRSEKVTKKV